MVGAQLLRVADEHEPLLRRADPSPDGIEHRTQQRFHAPRRDIDDQPPALAFCYLREVLAEQVEMPIPLERRGRFQNGPEVLHKGSQVALQLDAVKLEL